MLKFLTVLKSSLGQKPIIGHRPGTGPVDIIAGMNVQDPAIHGTTTPTFVIQSL